MTLRAPNPYKAYQSQIHLQRSKERMAIQIEQLTTGKKITRLSDDPTGAALVMNFTTSIERNNMYVKQGENAASFLKGTEAALNALVVQLDRLLELGQQGLSDLNEGRGREAISAEVDGLRTIIRDIANTKEQGKYIFAGTNTNTMPFVDNDDGNFNWAAYLADPTDPNFAYATSTAGNGVAYAGNAYVIDVDISVNSHITTNLTGSLVFHGEAAGTGTGVGSFSDVFAMVTMLRDGLREDNKEWIQTAYDNLRSIQHHISSCLTIVGARQTQIENSSMNLGDMNESLQSIQNAYEATDYPWTIQDFVTEQTAQEAALSTMAKMNRYSLFDYIG
jgi:flagellar hook-associated protein 3 FlgL